MKLRRCVFWSKSISKSTFRLRFLILRELNTWTRFDLPKLYEGHSWNRIAEMSTTGSSRRPQFHETVANVETKTPDPNAHLVRSIKVNACANLYQEWYRLGIHKRKPLDGLDFNVVFFDSMPNASMDTPVILALHGTAGSHRNFYAILPQLMQTGARVLIPNFPGCGYTDGDKRRKFSHTDQERAMFVLDFLNTLEIPRIHTIIGHSAAMYPLTYLMRNNICQSLVLLSPGAHRPVTMIPPAWLASLLVSLMEFPGMSVLYRILKPIIFRKSPSLVMIDYEQMKIGAMSLILVNYDNVKEMLLRVKFSSLPILLAYCEDDDVVPKGIFREMADLLGIDRENTIRYDVDLKPDGQNGLDDPKKTLNLRARGLIFEAGGHFIMKTNPELVGNAIKDLFLFAKTQNTVNKV